MARFFCEVGIDAEWVVGIADAKAKMLKASSRDEAPDVMLCEYDLLATTSKEQWASNDMFAHTPVLAVSLTRRLNEMHPLDLKDIAGFLYLPTLQAADAHRLLHSLATHGSHPSSASLAEYRQSNPSAEERTTA